MSDGLLYFDEFSYRRISALQFIALVAASLAGIILPILLSLELFKAAVFWFLALLVISGALVLYNPRYSKKELILTFNFFKIKFGKFEEKIPVNKIAFFEVTPSSREFNETISAPPGSGWNWKFSRPGMFTVGDTRWIYLGPAYTYFKLKIRKNSVDKYAALCFPVSDPKAFIESVLKLKESISV
ncbi:MAG: hypothetical protein ACTSSJ_05755 [Candidatus Odinarchaeia archaeon]